MKIRLAFLLAALVIVVNPCQAQDIGLKDPNVLAIQEQVLLPFLKALKTGDVDVIRHHLSRDLYVKNRILIDENQDYPEFLRNYYKDISFRIVSAKEVFPGNGIVFSVSFDHMRGTSSIHELKLLKEKSDNLQSDVWVVQEF